jgi:hypothetical protein
MTIARPKPKVGSKNRYGFDAVKFKPIAGCSTAPVAVHDRSMDEAQPDMAVVGRACQGSDGRMAMGLGASKDDWRLRQRDLDLLSCRQRNRAWGHQGGAECVNRVWRRRQRPRFASFLHGPAGFMVRSAGAP